MVKHSLQAQWRLLEFPLKLTILRALLFLNICFFLKKRINSLYLINSLIKSWKGYFKVNPPPHVSPAPNCASQWWSHGNNGSSEAMILTLYCQQHFHSLTHYTKEKENCDGLATRQRKKKSFISSFRSMCPLPDSCPSLSPNYHSVLVSFLEFIGRPPLYHCTYTCTLQARIHKWWTMSSYFWSKPGHFT